MNHQPLTDLLEELATAAGCASFWHGKRSAMNINYNEPFPQAHLFLMPSQLKGGAITTQVAMCFYGKDEHENGSEQSIAIQNEMDVLTQRFHAAFAEQDDVELVGDTMERVPVLRQGAGIGTGYFVNFTLTHLAQCRP
ncbi:hypothetical protein [Hymenobacter sp. B81]|uniref:hypothetical protein n=1 Tax=Hymenobacter sp. B81 TaxID=3344878 RepID=UPI0037DCECBD